MRHARSASSPRPAQAAPRLRPQIGRSLKNRVAVILADNDEAGESFAEAVAEQCRKAGASGDIVDVVKIESGDTESVHEKLEALALETEPEPREEPSDDRSVPFPVEALPEPVRRFVVEASTAIGCDASYVALPLLSGLASAIGNSRRLQLKRSWTEPAIIWTGVVSESNTMKSPAIEAALRPIRARQQQHIGEHAEALEALRAQYAVWELADTEWKATAKKEMKAGRAAAEVAADRPAAPSPPVRPRTWTDDRATEALIELLQENRGSILVRRDELAGWLGSFDRDASGAGGDEAANWSKLEACCSSTRLRPAAGWAGDRGRGKRTRADRKSDHHLRRDAAVLLWKWLHADTRLAAC